MKSQDVKKLGINGGYLEITYKTFEYKKYEDLVLLAAKDVGLNTEYAQNLFKKWNFLRPWPETNEILKLISQKYLIGFATNCSIQKGEEVANIIVSKKDEIIKTLPLYAAEDLKKVNFFKSLLTSLNYLIWGDV